VLPGTGQVVRGALRNGTPVVWIPWSTPDKWRLGIPPIRLNEKTADLFVDRDRLSEIIRKGIIAKPLMFRAAYNSNQYKQ